VFDGEFNRRMRRVELPNRQVVHGGSFAKSNVARSCYEAEQSEVKLSVEWLGSKKVVAMQ
jgi:hypothetical protein